ncbi:MAG: DNA polymerase domain-containing protein [Firmicutes bacterium]|nr:DNA polymerase domain-containing protein [Bacillota bacterium]
MERMTSMRFTHLDKVLWPREAYTKYDLIRYFLEVAPYLLPHLRNRPLVVTRYPNGISGEGFYQKNLPQGAPSWLESVDIQHDGSKKTRYLLPQKAEDLAWLGNQACLELHPWLSSIGRLDNPDFIVFDIDPMENSTFEQVREVALAIRKALSELGLKCWAKTSGATGIQVYLPVEPLYNYQEGRDFAYSISLLVHSRLPQLTTLERKIKDREGKIYLDYLQNVRGKTLVAPYSPRPLTGAPVSTPLSWEEVEKGTFFPGDFHLKNINRRLQEKGDLLSPVLSCKQRPLISVPG